MLNFTIEQLNVLIDHLPADVDQVAEPLRMINTEAANMKAQQRHDLEWKQERRRQHRNTQNILQVELGVLITTLKNLDPTMFTEPTEPSYNKTTTLAFIVGERTHTVTAILPDRSEHRFFRRPRVELLRYVLEGEFTNWRKVQFKNPKTVIDRIKAAQL
ncbi:MAG: hypothetical protein DRI37_09290 [Chloroflexi bacterium]|nr:MAG: hypothetical protein DRI37_09290 [Chloroflexota bacterium]